MEQGSELDQLLTGNLPIPFSGKVKDCFLSICSNLSEPDKRAKLSCSNTREIPAKFLFQLLNF